MKKIVTQPKKTFFEQNKDLIVVGSVIVVLAGGAVAYMYYKKKKDQKEVDLAQNQENTPQIIPINTTIPVSSSSGSSSSSSSTPRIKYVKTGYPLKYRTRHQDVKILQAYLKIYKENLGKSGSKRDGVDGVFGPLTLKAAKKRLGKAEFTEKDIAGMRKALKMVGK